jgi:hypothetical protein
LLRALLKFNSVYSTDFKKCEYVPDFISSFLEYTKQKLSAISCTDYLFLIQIWVQIRDSEHAIFVEKMEQFHELIALFVNIDRDLLESLYFEDPLTMEQVVSPLGRIMRLVGFQYSAQLQVNRLNTFGHRTDPQDRVETAWTISLISGMLSHRISYQASSDDDRNDGILAGTVFGFVQFKSFQNINDSCDELLELAILGFFEQFKHTYLTGDGSNCPNTWEAIFSNGQMSTQGDVLIAYLQRSLYFLKESGSEQLVIKSANLFQELVNGVHTCKLLQGSNLLQYIDESGIFGLFINCSYAKSKIIMKFFESIGRLFFSHQFNESPEANLKKLLVPIAEYFENYSSTGFDILQMDLIIRKLRGILSAIYTPKLYQHFLDWVLPYFSLLGAFLESDTCVNGPSNTLRFIREIATNKVNRLSFDTASEYGILMFREVIRVSGLLVRNLDVLFTSNLNELDWTKTCLKPLTIILETLKATVSSKAVPFGILRLYEDPSLTQMIQMGFLLSSNVNYLQIAEFQKLAAAYFGFWVQMTSDWMPYLMPTITSDCFAQLMLNLFRTLENQDNAISSQACTVANSIFSVVYEKNGQFYGIDTTYYQQKITQIILARIFTTDLETQWSFTRPLLPLILCNGDWFTAYLEHVVSLQSPPSDTHQKVYFFHVVIIWYFK